MTSHAGGKVIFAGIFGIVGYFLGFWGAGAFRWGMLGLIWGILLAGLIFLLDWEIRKIDSRTIIGGIGGGFLGLVLARVLTQSFFEYFSPKVSWAIYAQSSVICLCFVVGLMLGATRIQHLTLASMRQFFSDQPATKNYKILDTSVIIDGRIADIAETGFLEGVLIIPQFILKELQHIADSSDPIKRNRGRRGLEILHKIQKRIDVQVEIDEQDFPKIKEIDAKLVELAKLLQAKLITNDFNLNKVAELQGVSVLNVNELANALKPVVLPGEVIEVQVLKEGKEYGQGIAYLDDGTMIVIDHAKKLIGKTVSVSVTSVLQTTAGRMIFGQLTTEGNMR